MELALEERKRETVRLKDHFNNNSVAYGEEGKETSREGAWGGKEAEMGGATSFLDASPVMERQASPESPRRD